MTTSHSKKNESTAFPSELKPEQALGLVGLGLLQKLSSQKLENLNWESEFNEKADLHSLRQRLELTSLAIETGAPLSTSEVTQLLGVRPHSSKTDRGGITARRLSRNVWRLTNSSNDSNYWRN